MAPDTLTQEPKRTFSKDDRLRKRREFLEVYSERNTRSFGHAVVYMKENGKACGRLGLTVSKKVGCAVLRNRAKRVLREAFRLSPARGMRQGFDFVVNARKRAASMTFEEAALMFAELAEQAGK